jgi:hypothetical protein
MRPSHDQMSTPESTTESTTSAAGGRPESLERSRPPTRLVERFWRRVDATAGFADGACWTWTGVTNADGYGRLGTRLAHRLAWEITVGPIPEGLVVLHVCDRPACVRPEHLAVGLPGANRADSVAKGRAWWQR